MREDYRQAPFPVRKNPRIKGYDYSTPNYYFVTICTQRKLCIFGSEKGSNQWGKLAETGLQEIEKHFSCVRIDKYIVMPNHIHAIVVLEPGASTLSTVVGQYKAYVTRAIRKIKPDAEVWQSSFHDHVIRNQESYEKIWNYIDGNLQKWQDDCYYPTEP